MSLATTILSIALGAALPTEPPQQPPDAARVPAAAYRQVLEELCSEAMEGRGVGTPGGERAIRYLVAEFEAAGLQPLFGESLQQAFLAPRPPECDPATHCRVLIDGTAHECAVGSQFVPFPFSVDGAFAPAGAHDVGAPLVFAGHGLVAPELGIDDYRGLDVRGRIVLVLRGGPRWRELDSPVCRDLSVVSFAQKAAHAAQRGALGVLLVDRADEPGLDAESVQRARGSSTVPFAWIDRAAIERGLPAGWLAEAQRSLDAGVAPKPLPTPLRIVGTVALLRPTPRATANVLALVPPQGSDGATEWVVVGAHHDHIGRGEWGSLGRGAEIGRIHPGADDNASGVAALLELARRFRAVAPRRRGLVVAAFGGEELGQAGSRWFLDHVPPGVVLAAMVDLNMIGRARSGELAVYGCGSAAGLGPLVARAARSVPTLRVVPRDRSSYRSDQREFLARAVPALLFTTGLHDQYHRPGDVPALVEVEAALQAVDLVEQVLRELLDGERPEFQRESGR